MERRLTEGQRFRMVLENDFRVRSKSGAPRMSQRIFQHNYAQVEQESAVNQQKPLNSKTARLVGLSVGETVSFIERARFIYDHGSAEVRDALLSDQITFQEAWKLSRREREIRRLRVPSIVPHSVGEFLAKLATECNPILTSSSRWTEEQRDVVALICSRLSEAEFITTTELEAILAACFRRKPGFWGGSSMSERSGGCNAS